MVKIKETKSYSFGNKILKLQDVYDVAIILNNEFLTKRSEGIHCKINFTIICQDGTSYESSDIDIFKPSSIINSKKIKSIQLWYSNYESDDRIRISFKEECSGKYSDNSLYVEGYDTNWVNGLLGRIIERIDSIEPQNPNKKLYLNLIYFASALLIGRIFTFLILLLPLGQPDESKMSTFTLLIRHIVQANVFTYNFSLYFLGFFVGIFPASYIRDYFEKLWPYFEFQIGPTHQYEESKKRAKIRNLVTLIIIPLILAILYDMFKSLLE